MSKKTAVASKTDTNKCTRCKSTCCKYITITIPTPVSKQDFDGLLWQIAHKNINIFKDSDGWYFIIQTPCEHLKRDGRCGIYLDRPNVCRDHSANECEYDDPIEENAELYFKTYADLDTYCLERFKTWKQRLKSGD